MSLIRAATLQDADAIAHVHVESWRTTYAGIVPEACLASLNEAERAASWREWLTLDVAVYVAEVDGAIAGFACGGAIREALQEFDAELFAMYLLQHAQRRGIGTDLLRTMARTLRTRGFKSMMAWVLASNSSSHFYAKTGAAPVSSTETEMCGAMLPVAAYGWPSLEALAAIE